MVLLYVLSIYHNNGNSERNAHTWEEAEEVNHSRLSSLKVS